MCMLNSGIVDDSDELTRSQLFLYQTTGRATFLAFGLIKYQNLHVKLRIN